MTIDDIKLLKNNERKTSACIEFFVGDWEKKKSFWNEESVFIDETIFHYVFTECFKKTNITFNYFGETKYSRENLLVLVDCLKQNLQTLVAVYTHTDVIKLSEHYSNPPPNTSFQDALSSEFKVHWQEDWHQVIQQLIEINRGLIDLAEDCLDKHKVLWVLGV